MVQTRQVEVDVYDPYDDTQDQIEWPGEPPLQADDDRADLVKKLLAAIVLSSLHPLSETAVAREASRLLELAWAEYVSQELRDALDELKYRPEIRTDRTGRLYARGSNLTSSSGWAAQAGRLAEEIAALELPERYHTHRR